MKKVKPHMSYGRVARMTLGAFALVYCLAAHAVPILSLDKTKQSYSLGELVEYVEEESGQLDIKELTQRPESVWKKHAGKIPNFGFSRSAYWFRIRLQTNEPLRWLLEVEYPLLDEISMYTFDGARPLQTIQTGDTRPFIERPLKHVAFVMPLVLPPAQPVTVYLRVKSMGTMQVPINLWQEDAYFEHDEAITALKGVYFGIVLIMVFYNLFFYLMVREPAYIHYVLFVTMFGLFTAGLSGWGYRYLWPEAVRFQQYNTAVFLCLSLIFASRFIRHFLDLPRTAPRIGHLLFGVVLSQLAVLILLPVIGYHVAVQIALAMTLVTCLTALYAGVLLWRHGEPTAHYFTIAWSLFLLSAMLATLEKFGVIPSTFWADFFLPLGVVAIVSLLSLALAERLNVEKHQRIQAQQQLIQQQEKNQKELEQQVNERTGELKEANQSLEKELIDHRKAELALHDSEERFRKAFQDSAIGMALVGLDGHWLKVNDALCRIVGYSEQELLSRTFQDITYPDDLPLDMDFKDRLLSGEIDHFQSEKRYVHKDGHVVWVRLSVSLIRDAQNSPIHFVTQVDDITVRKQAMQTIEESERKFRAILEAAVDGILVADAQTHKFILGNRAICEMLGYLPDEIAQLGVDDIHPAQALPEVRRQFERQLKGEIRAAASLPIKRKDGSVFFADISSSPMELAGHPYLVGVFHDVTERMQAEEDIRKLNEGLEVKVQKRTQQLLEAQEELVRKEKLAVLGQVAGSVGHELRNPLGVMNNAVYYLQTVLSEADDSIKEYLDIIRNEIANSERIVSDLLDSVRTQPPHPESASVHQIIEQTVGKLTIPSNVRITRDLPETLPMLWVDVLQMQQVFRNLISNGIEAMPQGGTLDIGAAENKQDGTVTVSVRDSGSGITPEQLGKLFQPLYTTKARGIGLGLVVVKNLTQANGGQVAVKSKTGQGTTFTVTLPANYSSNEGAK